MNSTLKADLNEAVSQLISGKIIGFPTETFYGLGASPSHRQGVRMLMVLKERTALAGIPIIIDSEERLEEWISETTLDLSAARKKLQQTFWPGPLTLVIGTNDKARKFFRKEIFGANYSLALRLSSSTIARSLAAAVGGAITATSANKKGFPPAQDAAAVRSYFPDIFVVDEAPGHQEALPSTILDVRKFPFQILREGAIAKEKLESFLVIAQ